MIFAETCRQYFEQHALRNYNEYKSDPADLSRAVNAAIALNHVADHVFKEKEEYWAGVCPPRGKQSGQAAFNAFVEAQSPSLASIRTLANATKHDTDMVSLLSNPTWEEADFTWGQGENVTWEDTAKTLAVPRNGNPVSVVEAAFDDAVEFWPRFMAAHGVW